MPNAFVWPAKPSRSAALSQLMTPVVRTAMTMAPLHLTRSPAPGTGKSFLNDLASTIATGERCAVIAVAPNREETEKRLIGAALMGWPIIAIDNVNDELSGNFLSQVTERPLLQLRRGLGEFDREAMAALGADDRQARGFETLQRPCRCGGFGGNGSENAEPQDRAAGHHEGRSNLGVPGHSRRRRRHAEAGYGRPKVAMRSMRQTNSTRFSSIDGSRRA